MPSNGKIISPYGGKTFMKIPRGGKIISISDDGRKIIQTPQGIIRSRDDKVAEQRRTVMPVFYNYLADNGNRTLKDNYDKNPEEMLKKSRVILVCGGGALKGVVHAAFLKALEDWGIYVDAGAGTSAGALALALYMGGISPQEIREAMESVFRRLGDGAWNITRSLDWEGFFGRLAYGQIKVAGIENNGPIASVIRKYLPNVKTFEDLKNPNLFITSTTHGSKRQIAFGPGYTEYDFLFDQAVRASCNMPGTFSPVYVAYKQLTSIDGMRRTLRQYVKGGILTERFAGDELVRAGIPMGMLTKETIPVKEAYLYDGGERDNVPLDLAWLNYDPERDVILVVVLGYPGKEEETYGPDEARKIREGRLRSFVGNPPPNARGCPGFLSAVSGGMGASMAENWESAQILFAGGNVIIFQSKLWDIPLTGFDKFNALYKEGQALFNDFMTAQGAKLFKERG